MNIQIGDKTVGEGNPCYVIGEIGINYNGEMDIAKKLINVAKEAGCDAVKFQKRTPELCVPVEQRSVMRETPWGMMTYMEYKQRMEMDYDDYKEIDQYCKEKDIQWFASPWDIKSVDFLEQFDMPCYKLPSALIVNHQLVKACNETGKPVMISTGMSTMQEIEEAIALIDPTRLLVAHCTSTYPAPVDQLNLKMISVLKEKFGGVVGYSGHEVGLSPTYAAVVLGAHFVERHITLDRTMWGSDHAASIEPGGLRRLVENIRDLETAMGDGVKKVYEEEKIAMKRLRVSV